MTTLYEIVQSRDLQIDKEKGTIAGVRILGPKSSNGRTYSPEAIKGAIGMYEGRAVNTNHPPRGAPNQERQVGDRVGWLENVKQDADGGLSGTLNILTTHPMAGPVMEAADRNPRLFGLSHNVEARSRRDNGTTFVEEITKVRSVDLVSDPASTKSLFESKETIVKKPILTMLREVCTTPNRKATLLEIEGEELVSPEMTAEVPEPEEEKDPDADEQIVIALNTAAKAAIDDSSLDAMATVQKVKEIMVAKDKLISDTPPEKKKTEDEPAVAESADIKALRGDVRHLTEAITELKGRVGVERPKSGLRESNGNGDKFVPAKDAREFATRITR